MTAVHTLLLSPPSHDPGKLLREGPAGYRPPMLRSGWNCAYPAHHRWTEEGRPTCYMCGESGERVGLLLVHEGEVVLAGYDVAWNAFAKHGRVGSTSVKTSYPSVENALALVACCVRAGLGESFALDAQGEPIGFGAAEDARGE